MRSNISEKMSENEKNETINLEEEVFKALDHQMRRNILHYVGEAKSVSFTEIINNIKIPDSPTLSYHLKTLNPFVEQRDGSYRLTVIGRGAYNLLLKTSSYSRLALFWRNKRNATMGTGLLWLIDIVGAIYLGLDVMYWTVILPFLAVIAMSTVYQLFE
jgi:DNA-binding transcriptional ArsR family regulator